jgi:hypothetical protein
VKIVADEEVGHASESSSQLYNSLLGAWLKQMSNPGCIAVLIIRASSQKDAIGEKTIWIAYIGRNQFVYRVFVVGFLLP